MVHGQGAGHNGQQLQPANLETQMAQVPHYDRGEGKEEDFNEFKKKFIFSFFTSFSPAAEVKTQTAGFSPSMPRSSPLLCLF